MLRAFANAIVCSLGLFCAARSLADAADDPAAAEPPQTTSYFVSVVGDDANDGSEAKPFATLSRATQAMETGTIKHTYVQNGVYELSSPLMLDDRDSGEQLLGYPGHEPTLSGHAAGLAAIIILQDAKDIRISGLTLADAGDQGAILLSHSSNITISGNHLAANGNGIILQTGSTANVIVDNQIDASFNSAIEVMDGSDSNTLDNNFINGTGAIGTKGGGFFLHGVSKNRISHNLVENTAGMGIGIENWDATTVNIDNIVEYNVVRNSNIDPASDDSGAIYVLGRSQLQTGMVIRDNLVSGTGAPHPAHTIGVYLDDLSNGVIVENNILTGIGSDAVQIHGGQNNLVTNNIIDTGSDRATAMLFQAAPEDTHAAIAMTDNVVSRNIIYSSSMKPVIFVSYDGGKPIILDNLYYNSADVLMIPSGVDVDLQPRFGNPGFANAAARDFTVSPESPTAASIGFIPIDQRQIGLRPRN